MLPEVGASELIVIAAVALIVVGPKDLPVLLRKIGGFMTRMRGLAAEFRASFDEMARQSELDDLRKQVEALRQGTLDPTHADIEGTFRAIDHDLAMPGIGGEAPLTAHADEAAAEAVADVGLTPSGVVDPDSARRGSGGKAPRTPPADKAPAKALADIDLTTGGAIAPTLAQLLSAQPEPAEPEADEPQPRRPETRA